MKRSARHCPAPTSGEIEAMVEELVSAGLVFRGIRPDGEAVVVAKEHRLAFLADGGRLA